MGGSGAGVARGRPSGVGLASAGALFVLLVSLPALPAAPARAALQGPGGLGITQTSSGPAGPSPRGPLSAGISWLNQSAVYAPLPPGRSSDDLVYDPASHEEVLYGGTGSCGNCSSTYVLQGTQWSLVAQPNATTPPSRSWASMAYDPSLGGVVLFGGESNTNDSALDDTWVFHGEQWVPLNPASSPPARWSAGMAWDAADNVLLLFGGYSPQVGFLSDTWAFAGGTWTQLSPTTSPPPRWAPTMVDDAADGYVLLFGGYSPTSGFLGDTWSFADGEWTSRTGSVGPPPREKGAMEFDPALGQVVLFGGDLCVQGCLSSSPYTYLDDTWTYAGGVWTNATSAAGLPNARCCSVLSFDGDRGALLLFSGRGYPSHPFQDIWVLNTPTSSIEPVGIWVAPGTIALGEGFTVSVGVHVPHASPTFVYPRLPPGCSSLNASVLYCVPTAEGVFNVSAQVTDRGPFAQVNLSSLVTVTGPVETYQDPGWPGWTTGWAPAAGLLAAAVVLLVRVTREGPAHDAPVSAPSPRGGS